MSVENGGGKTAYASPPRSPYRLSRFQRAAVDEHRQPPEEDLLRRREEVVAPGDRVPHRLQAQRPIAAPARQQRQPPFQPLPQRRQRQVGDARRGELDRQGHAVQPPADVRHQWRVAV